MSYTYPPAKLDSVQTFVNPIHHDTYAAISPTNSNLTGKSVFLTGASKGVGRATALSYAKAGASQIAIAARSDLSSLVTEMLSAAKLASHPVPQILPLKLDVQNLESVKAAAQETEKEFGRLDILINNAGYLETSRPVMDSDVDEYWMTWEINYRGMFWVTKFLLPLLLKTEEGLKTIVNVSSIGAHNLRLGASGYQVSKFAILKFSEFLCAEYAQRGVVAYCVHPGGVQTELAMNLPKAVHPLLVDKPELAGDSLVFLTQERREWLAGRFLSLNWDIPTLMSMKDEIVNGDKLKMRLVV